MTAKTEHSWLYNCLAEVAYSNEMERYGSIFEMLWQKEGEYPQIAQLERDIDEEIVKAIYINNTVVR